MTTPTEDHTPLEIVANRVDLSLSLARVLQQLFGHWENESNMGTTYEMKVILPLDLRAAMDLLIEQLEQASELLGHLEPLCNQSKGHA